MRDLDVANLGVVVDDRDPQAIFDAMVVAVQDRLPDWVPNNAALEVVLLEAFATASADWIYATNRTVGAMVEAVLALYGVARDEGAANTSTLTLTFDGSVTTTIAQGSTFISEDGVAVLVSQDTPVSGTSVVIDVEESVPGEAGLLEAGATFSPLIGIARLSTCTLDAVFAGGRPSETTDAYIARSATRLRRVTSAVTTAPQFTAYGLEQPAVGRAYTIDKYNAATSSTANGHVTVVLYGKGAALSTDDLETIQDLFDKASASILTVHVITADRPTVAITAGITVASGYVAGDVQDACEEALTDWLSWSNVSFGQTITPSAIEAILENIDGVSTATVTTPSGNVTHDLWDLPAPGTITINV